MMFVNLSDIAFLNIKATGYCCTISLTSKNEAINFLQNADLTEKSGTLLNVKKVFSYMKMGKEHLIFWQY